MLAGFGLLDHLLVVTQGLQVFSPAEMSLRLAHLPRRVIGQGMEGEGKGKKDKKNKSDEEPERNKQEDDESTSLSVCLTTFGFE